MTRGRPGGNQLPVASASLHDIVCLCFATGIHRLFSAVSSVSWRFFRFGLYFWLNPPVGAAFRGRPAAQPPLDCACKAIRLDPGVPAGSRGTKAGNSSRRSRGKNAKQSKSGI